MRLPDDDADLLPGATSARTQQLRATVQRLTASPCGECQKALCGHEAVLAVVLGHQHAARCAACLAAALAEAPDSLCERALQWIVRRECFVTCWEEASVAEGHRDLRRPACLFAAPATRATPAGVATPASAAQPAAPATPPRHAADARYDAGDLACGDLVLELRFRLQGLPPGAVVQVTARDPAAPIDLPAWCGLCGHTLLHAVPPDYWIQRKGDRP